jgi:hypothetical protein
MDATASGRSIEARLAKALRERGHEVDVGVGTSEFRCNLGIRERGDDRYRLGILIDDPVQHARPVDEVMQVQPSGAGAPENRDRAWQRRIAVRGLVRPAALIFS